MTHHESRITLRPYQQEVTRAVLRSVHQRLGLTFSVEIARQGGKNEISAHMERYLLGVNSVRGGAGVKAAPTWRPQALTSLQRLKTRLAEEGLPFQVEQGYQVVVGAARWLFLSGGEASNVVGATATILLEGDEAQDLSREKWDRDFRPMGAVANTTSVLYGTAWDRADLLQQTKHANLELERKDGLRRHFGYDWRAVAEHNPHYRAYVEAERERLGAGHPLFTTQYELQPLSGRARMLQPAHLTLLRGSFPQEEVAGPWTYVAGLDVAGGAEQRAQDLAALEARRPRDAMVLTIAALREARNVGQAPSLAIHVVHTYSWTDVPHHTTIPQVQDLARHWRLRQLVVDATGQGEAVASILTRHLGRIVTPFVFTGASKSDLAYQFLAAVHRGDLRVHAGAPGELWRQLELARTHVRPSRLMDFYVDPREGHDDYLMSLALTIHAAATVQPERTARGRADVVQSPRSKVQGDVPRTLDVGPWTLDRGPALKGSV